MMEAEHGEDREAEATHKGRATAETTAPDAAGASASQRAGQRANTPGESASVATMDARFPAGPPDYIHRVAGVRIWRIAPTLWWQLGGLLWSPAMKEPWTTGEEYHASCAADHEAGSAGCKCGVYAFYTPKLAQAGGYWAAGDRLVAGVIGAAGDIDLASSGMRAGRATVEAIFTAGAADALLPLTRQEIADGYGAEVIDEDDYEEFCERRDLIVFSPDDF